MKRTLPHNTSFNFFGYPNVGISSTHFNITPFEAVFTDPHTYEHIKLEDSKDPNHPEYLDYLRDFIVNEVEADVVYFQNQVIGQNHINQSTYKYKAWYKAKNEIIMGADVTSKTDIGDYIIQKTGDITVYAGDAVYLEPGFSAEDGSNFLAFISNDGCYNSAIAISDEDNTTKHKESEVIRSNSVKPLTPDNQTNKPSQLQLFPNPNKGEFTLVLPDRETSGIIIVNDLYGKTLYTQQMNENRFKIALNLPQGIYLLHYMNAEKVQTLQFVIQ